MVTDLLKKITFANKQVELDTSDPTKMVAELQSNPAVTDDFKSMHIVADFG